MEPSICWTPYAEILSDHLGLERRNGNPPAQVPWQIKGVARIPYVWHQSLLTTFQQCQHLGDEGRFSKVWRESKKNLTFPPELLPGIKKGDPVGSPACLPPKAQKRQNWNRETFLLEPRYPSNLHLCRGGASSCPQALQLLFRTH